MKTRVYNLLAIGLLVVSSIAHATTQVVQTRDRRGLLGGGGILGTGIGRRDKTVIIEKECGPCDKAGHSEVKENKKSTGFFGGRDEMLIIKETECCIK